MEELDEVIDVESSQPKDTPGGVKTLAIFSIIGNGFWSLVLLIFTAYVMFAGSVLDSFLPGFAQDIIVLIVVILIVLLGLHIAGLIAAINMMRGKKKAFILYAIVTGIWVLLLVMSAINPDPGQDVTFNWICAVLSTGFIVGFGLQMKNMPD